MKTRLIYLLVLLMTGSILFSCSKDDDDDNPDSYTFIDQVLQGLIEGDEWTYLSGSAMVYSGDSTQLFFEMVDIISDDPCNEIFNANNKVMFFIPAAVGVYELKFDMSGEDVQLLTLFHSETVMSTGVSEGAIEITLIDADNGIVEGRIVAEYSENNFVNGNFSVTYCLD